MKLSDVSNYQVLVALANTATPEKAIRTWKSGTLTNKG